MKKERLNIAVVYVVRNQGFATLWFENGTLGGNTFSRDRTSIFIRVNRRATKLGHRPQKPRPLDPGKPKLTVTISPCSPHPTDPDVYLSNHTMNQVNAILKMNADELTHNIAGTTASWHEQYKGNAWVFVGGLVENLTEGDVLAVCSQYGEIEDFHLVRDEDTGKSKGFGFLKYEDERSTVLAVDNLNGYKLLSKTLRVDHTDYRPPKKKKKEIEAEDATGSTYVAQTSGHAYVGKDLATNHSLTSGMDVFNPHLDPTPKANTVVSSSSSSSSGSGSNAVAVATNSSGNNAMETARVVQAEQKKRKRHEKKMVKAQRKKAKKIAKREKKDHKKRKKDKKKSKKKQKKNKTTKQNSSEESSGSSSDSDGNEDLLLQKAQQFLQQNQ